MIIIFFSAQPEELTRTLEISNLVFSTLFAVEMLLKLLAFGIFGYVKNGFNVFDGIIVILRYVHFSTFTSYINHLSLHLIIVAQK